MRLDMKIGHCVWSDNIQMKRNLRFVLCLFLFYSQLFIVSGCKKELKFQILILHTPFLLFDIIVE